VSDKGDENVCIYGKTAHWGASYVIKTSRTIIGVNVQLKNKVSEILSASILSIDVDPDDGDRGNL
jgi:hypothetical protein